MRDRAEPFVQHDDRRAAGVALRPAALEPLSADHDEVDSDGSEASRPMGEPPPGTSRKARSL